VLMLNSDVFRAMFNYETTREAREGRIQITDSTGTAVRQMLIYMYTGELPMEYDTETDAGPLMHMANKYLIKALIQLIEQDLVNRFALRFKICLPFLAPSYFLWYIISGMKEVSQKN
jgi:hypothetical protein